MNSTGRQQGSGVPVGTAAALILGCLLACAAMLVCPPARAADDPVPRPPQLERDVQFWVRVYTQIDTNAGFLHDQSNLGVLYETLHFAPDSPPSERQHIVEQARERYAAALRRIAGSGDGDLSPEDQRVRDLW